jgi:hypothetical protein
MTLLTCRRFVDAEKWRKETKLDELLPTWDYPEKEQIFQYYPQYYHGTDKVRCEPAIIPTTPGISAHQGTGKCRLRVLI